MAMASPITFEAPGILLTVHEDRVEVESGKRRQSIPLAGVAEVKVTPRPKKLVIVTTEGKSYQFGLGRDAEPARAVIASQLAGTRL